MFDKLPRFSCLSDFCKKIERKPGDRWGVRGPAEYVPSVSVDVVCKRTAIPLDENEGIYIRNVKTGKVRSVSGATYMLNQDEELWEVRFYFFLFACILLNEILFWF